MLTEFVFIVPWVFASLLLHIVRKLGENALLRIIVLGVSLILFGAFLDLGIISINNYRSTEGFSTILQLPLWLGGAVYYICALGDVIPRKRDKQS